MKVVFGKNKFISYELGKSDGFIFKPRNKISNLIVVNRNLISLILLKKVKKDINKVKKTIKLMLESDVTLISDCDMMLNEIRRILICIEDKYRIYLDEFDYFELIKELYTLNMELNLKKKLLDNNI